MCMCVCFSKGVLLQFFVRSPVNINNTIKTNSSLLNSPSWLVGSSPI